MREYKFSGWAAFIKRGSKMFTGLQGQKIMYTTSFVRKIGRKKILVSIRAKLLECLGWLCMTLYLSFPSMYKLRYKSPFWKQSNRPCSRKLGHPMSFSFFLSLLYFLIYNILSLSLSKSSTGAVSLLSSPGSSPAVCCCTSMIKCI